MSEAISQSSSAANLMQAIVSLCKRRGFVFQSSEIYGGLKSAYDYGPLGVELKRNIAAEWWQDVVYKRENVVGLDSSIMMHSQVWHTSGHLSSFSDPLVDCLNCKERFRADKAPKATVGDTVEFLEFGKSGGKKLKAKVERAYVCPQCGAPTMSAERQFSGMFRSTIGPIDPIGEITETIMTMSQSKPNLDANEVLEGIRAVLNKHAVYLRPETAQGIFVQFNNVLQTMGMKVPFGVAQQGKAFRNEIVTEHFIFRSCEFEQMELEFFCEPGSQNEWLEYWKNERLNWFLRYANDKNAFRLRPHAPDELAHYSDACFDIEYKFPWGFDELEGIASRTDYDLKKHGEATNTKLSYFDQQKNDPITGKPGYRYIPYVIEPSAGLTRATLCFLLDAYTEEKAVDAKGEEKTRVFLKLHPKLAPYKAAILPLVKKDGQPELAEKLAAEFWQNRVNISLDMQQSIGKRYAKHDEIGTPFCITIDSESLLDGRATVRNRDTCVQERIELSHVYNYVQTRT